MCNRSPRRERAVEPQFVGRPCHDVIIHDQKRMATTNSREALRSGVTISRLSSGSAPRPSWSLAVFAHNESGRIGAALESVAAAADGHGVEVIVLANGCTDSTADEVRGCASAFTHLSLVEFD